MNKKFYVSVWRWHFFAGLYVIPFMLMLSITGLVMLAYPWIDAWQYGEKLTTVEQASTSTSLEQQASVVRAAYPDDRVAQYLPPINEHRSSIFKLAREGNSTLLVFVNPYSAEILGSFDNADRWYTISDDIHGTLLLGEAGDALIELAAGLGFLLLMTGLYLHWPSSASGITRMLMPSFLNPVLWRDRKRSSWKSVHGSAGFYLSFFLWFFLLTGMAWTGIWGAKLIQPWSSFPDEQSAAVWQSEPDAITHAQLNTDNLQEVPWGLEVSAVPESDNDQNLLPLTLDQAFRRAGELGFNVEDKGAFSQSFRIAFPKGETGVYSLMSVTMSRDNTNPFGDRTVHLDQYSGAVLADIGFEDYNAVAKAMAAGIAWHMGSAGWWNVILAAAICLGFIALSVTGAVLWWKRRNATSGMLPAAPPQPSDVTVPMSGKALIVLVVLTGVIFPVSGAVIAALALFELGRYRAVYQQGEITS
ncbi:PepSY-associated TM helix domain-containing protein [Parendozoicomonas haliclonae]|uniref:PepSY-associated TM helix n=1 Tax=Parendozoicomonas haliclonae TaxID=1960125 RepID=A0A1X7AKB5_9GAMM|nr:PepSY domain-containing protein [Parendozoicomonas haliclonae]SMA46734.1 hypothetical protein EHSB41UT_02249 [Parendozoicomonas haliclonae]